MPRLTTKPAALRRALRVTGAIGLLLALSGCVVYPYYPRYGYYRPPPPAYYGYR